MLLQTSARCPWSVPVPLSPGRFVSLLPRHQSCNRTTEQHDRAAFAVPEALPPKSLGFADHRLDPRGGGPRLAGASRSVFHGAHYLRGVGRTPLAGNWADRRDAARATGHLPVSVALRELVASVYARARGLDGGAVACEGILVAPLERRLAEPLARVAARTDARPVACDRHLQAISVRPGNFARWTNLLWLAQRTPATVEGILELAWACEHFAEVRDRLDHNRPRLADCSPTTIAEALGRAVARGFAALEARLRAGIFDAGELTVDGRVLDRGRATILGEPLIGRLEFRRSASARTPATFGAALVEHADRVADFLACLDDRLAYLERRAEIPQVAIFVGQWRAALTRTFAPPHPVSHRPTLATAIERLVRELGTPPRTGEQLSATLLGLAPDRASSTAIGLRIPPTIAEARARFTLAAGAPGPQSPDAAEHRRLLSELYAELDGTTDVGDYLDRLRRWISDLERAVAPRPRDVRATDHDCPSRSGREVARQPSPMSGGAQPVGAAPGGAERVRHVSPRPHPREGVCSFTRDSQESQPG